MNMPGQDKSIELEVMGGELVIPNITIGDGDYIELTVRVYGNRIKLHGGRAVVWRSSDLRPEDGLYFVRGTGTTIHRSEMLDNSISSLCGLMPAFGQWHEVTRRLEDLLAKPLMVCEECHALVQARKG